MLLAIRKGTEMLDGVAVEQISEGLLLALITNSVQETRVLEFKRDQIGTNDEAKKEFLKDVTALANTMGGDLVIGMDDDDGVAKALVGIPEPSDPEIRRLDAILQSNVEPRLHGVRMSPVPLSSGGYALIIRVPQSWNPPHRVSFKGWTKFFARSTAHAYELDVDQLRTAFLGSAEAERRITEFRVDRISKIKAGQSLVSTEMGQLVVHLCPLRSGVAISPAAARAVDDNFAPLKSSRFGGYTPSLNFDGLAILSGVSNDGKHFTTSQVFRNGNVEFASAQIVRPDQSRSIVWPMALEITKRIPGALTALVKLGAPPPFILMVSLLGVKDTHIVGSSVWDLEKAHNATHEDLLLPPAVIDEVKFDAGWQVVLKPMFDAWWNAYDLDRCVQYFDEAGEWIGPG